MSLTSTPHVSLREMINFSSSADYRLHRQLTNDESAASLNARNDAKVAAVIGAELASLSSGAGLDQSRHATPTKNRSVDSQVRLSTVVHFKY